MFKLIVAGSRSVTNKELVFDVLSKVLFKRKNVRIVSGTCRGPDCLGEGYSREILKQYPILMPADWDRYGRGAGYVRNSEMTKEASAAIVFWDGRSNGSKNMIELSRKHHDITIVCITDNHGIIDLVKYTK